MRLKKRPIVVIWNSASGWRNDETEAREVQQILSQTASPLVFKETRKGDNIAAVSRDSVSDEANVVVAAGGDGTLNAVAQAVVNSKHALGVLPAGTLNHFARDLSIPLTVPQAASALVNGKIRRVDVGVVNDRLFLNNSVIGLYPVYRAARDAYERKGLGRNRFTRFLAVVRGIVRVLLRPPKLRLQLTLEDGSSVRVETSFVLIANNEHELERWNIGRRRSLDEGHLWIYILKRNDRWSLMRFFVRFLFKRFSRHDAFHIFRAHRVHVDGPGEHLKVAVDGEVVRLKTPLEYRSLPRSLKVIAPASNASDVSSTGA